jgi:MGT family glycosyltransferase
VPFPTAPRHNLRDRGEDRVKDWLPRHPFRQLERVTRELMFGPAEAYARDVLAEIDRFRPEALAIDYMVFGGLVAAEKSGVPAATMMHTTYSMPTEGVPPFGLGFRPARGVLGRLRDRALRGLMVRAFDKQGRPPLNAARAALGLPPLAGVFDQVTRGQRILVLTARSYDFAARVELPPSVVYVGPQLDDPDWAAPWTSPWPSDATAPLVVVALGSTFQNQGEITQRVIDALGDLPVRGLVTLGGVFVPSDFRLPANVVAVGSAPHRAVLPLARAVVAHGGHGTVMKSLAHGLPLLCVPLGRDQADNAVRVAEAGAGLRVTPTAGTATIRRAIARLLDEPAFAAAAGRMAAEIERDVAADRAVAELEALAP